MVISLELTAAEAGALRILLARTLSRTIEQTLSDRPAEEIAAADRARDVLSVALYEALQTQEAPDASAS